ncbi:serine protease [Candidatus Pacearchaeota archaeon]|nr:serine protease [Candidatus Pacearchaeota archaeon]
MEKNKVKKFVPFIIVIFLIIASFLYLNNKINNLDLIKEERIVMTNNFAENVEKILPSIVLILVEVDLSEVDLVNGEYVTIGNKPNSKGTGFIVSENGYILTANHVVNKAKNKIVVRVIRNNKFEFHEAELVSSNEDADTALIKINLDNLPFLELGDYEKFKSGMDIGFIGFPLSFNLPLTHKGIISAKANTKLKEDGETINLFIVNAFVNKGNSGGPLFSADTGEVVGIINAKYNVIPQNLILPNLVMFPGVTLTMGGVDFNELTQTVALNRQLIVDLFSKGSSVGIGYSNSIQYGKELLEATR